MRFAILALAFLLGGCASTQDTHQESTTVAADFDRTWQAAVMAVSDIGFTVRNSDKDSGIINARGGRNLFTQNEAPELNIMVIRTDDPQQTRVRATAVQPGQVYDWGAGSGNSEKFFNALRNYAQ